MKKELKDRVKDYQKETSYGSIPYIDPLVIPICTLMNDNGLYTIGSCSGHIKVKKLMDKKNKRQTKFDSGGIQLFANRRNMRFIYHFIQEFKENSPFNIKLFVCTQQNKLFEKHELKNYLSIDYYPNLNTTTDDSLYDFHHSFYKSLKKALKNKGRYILKEAGTAVDRFLQVEIGTRNDSKERFVFNLEELEWEE